MKKSNHNFTQFEHEFQEQLEKASQSKQSFIQWLQDIEIIKVSPWVKDWLEEYWTDEMSKAFFGKNGYWNGSLDTETLYIGGQKFPSLLDDIEKCMNKLGKVAV